MKNKKLIELYSKLLNIKNLKGVQFNYCLARNIKKIESEVETLQKSVEQSKEFKGYEEKRVNLCKVHAKKNKEGEPMLIITDGLEQYDIEDKTTFNKELENLKKENQSILDERTQQIKEFEELLDKETSIELFKVKKENIPEDITTEQMNTILDLIEE